MASETITIPCLGGCLLGFGARGRGEIGEEDDEANN